MVLASSREGWANVLLESMACGTPVVATPAWGSREAVVAPEAGVVIDEATPEALASGIRRVLADPPRDTEVGEDGLLELREEDVGRLDVVMDPPRRMDAGEGGGEREEPTFDRQ